MTALPPNLDARAVLCELRAHGVEWSTDAEPTAEGWRATYVVVLPDVGPGCLLDGEVPVEGGDEDAALAAAARVALRAAWPYVQEELAWRRLWIIMWHAVRPKDPLPVVRAVRRGDGWGTRITPNLGFYIEAATPVETLTEASRHLWYYLAHEAYCRRDCRCPMSL